MAASPHPIDAVVDLIVARPSRMVMGVETYWDAALSRKFVKGETSVKSEISVYMSPPRPIERVDPVRPTASPGGVRKNALYMTAGAPITPIRFMGQSEEIRRIIVRLSLKWVANDYKTSHPLAVEINRYLFNQDLKGKFPLKKDVKNLNDISREDILDFHALNSEPILSGPFREYNYFAMNYSVDYITRPFK